MDGVDYPNERDCEHGRQRRKCEVCQLIAAESELAMLKSVDDDEQVAWPWLGEIGFTECGDLSRFITSNFCIEVSGGMAVTTLWLDNKPITDNPTRGDVLRLFSALKIELKKAVKGNHDWCANQSCKICSQRLKAESATLAN